MHTDSFHTAMTFGDFDAFASAVRDWRLEFIQLDRGPFHADLRQVGGGVFQLGQASFGSRLHQEGETPPGLRSFVVPGDPSFRILWRGRAITSDDIGVFPPGGILDSVSQPGFNVLIPSLPQALLDLRAESLGLPTVDDIAGSDEVVRCDPVAVARLRGWLRTALDELLERPALLEDGPTSESVAWSMAGHLVRTLAAGRPAPRALSIGPRLRVSEDSLDYIAAHAGRDITVRELAGAVGVSERTLRRTFQERFGVSTKRYLKIRRLRATRRDLLRQDPDRAQVRDVALRWGFWHSSQFAQDYRREFGELPSETLHRRHRDGQADTESRIARRRVP